MMRQRVAVFVDGENLASTHAAGILRIATERGEVLLARVYGNLGKLNGWSDAARYTVVHAGTGKNATDVLLSLDALELALDGRFDSCVVASSDGDFTHLVVRLRERGLRVVGAGESKTPPHFRAKCSEFVLLGTGGGATKPAVQPSAAPQRDALDDWIENAIADSGENGSIKITDLNAELHRQRSFCIKQRPEKTWKALIQQRHAFYERIPGPEPRLRLRTIRAHS
jgi:hypothetical protein